MPSQRQIEANRRNARLSTGPKTPEGKARASRNRSLHGFRSRNPLLPGEDPEEYAAALAAWRSEFQPANPHEDSLVRKLAAANWRLRRVPCLEVDIFTAGLSIQPGALDKWGRDPFGTLIRCQNSASRAFYKALHALTAREHKNERSNPIPALSSLEHENERSNPIPEMGRNDTMARAMTRTIPLFLAAAALPGLAQPLQSPEVHPDHRVTFRFRAPNAKAVLLDREGAERVPMQKDEQGVWSLTTDPLEPDLYGYTFVADGVNLIDPSNPLMKPNLLFTQSVVHVPGPASLPWEIGDVPRGAIHRHFYKSAVVGDHRDFYVYTPPGYDPKARKRYPVLYLLHGYSDDASGWTAVGRAHVILDNLIAQGQARPMLIVMTLGYGAPEILANGWKGIADRDLLQRNYDRYRDALLTEVIPQVEKAYRVAKDRNSRAIAGLSMGGAESLFVGLNALDRFAWIGAFSSGGLNEDFHAAYPALDSKANSRLRLLWIACGKDDRLIGVNRKLLEWLKSKEVRYTWTETAGAHTGLVWRRNLAQFASLVFQAKPK